MGGWVDVIFAQGFISIGLEVLAAFSIKFFEVLLLLHEGVYGTAVN
jgi:hypothetical protein